MSDQAAQNETIKIDPVIADIGIAGTIEGQAGIGGEITERLAPHLRDFLEGGGQFSWAEWTRLANETRCAAIFAGREINENHAALIAVKVSAALANPDYGVALAEGKDVEEVTNQRVVEEAVSSVVADSNPAV